MISFAFGAPNICGNKRAQEINDNAHLKVHFFNVTDESDPVAESLEDGLEGHEVKGDSAVRSGRWVRRFAIGEAVPLPSRHHQSRSSSIMNSCISGKIKPWSRERFINHYKSAVIAACKLSSVPSDNEDPSPQMKVDSPAPQVSVAFPVSLSWEYWLLEPVFIC